MKWYKSTAHTGEWVGRRRVESVVTEEFDGPDLPYVGLNAECWEHEGFDITMIDEGRGKVACQSRLYALKFKHPLPSKWWELSKTGEQVIHGTE